MEYGDGASWLAVLVQIFFVDLLLGADNALLIALACRSLGPEDMVRVILIGAGGAVLLRLLLIFVATSLLAVPFVKLIGAIVLVLIALNVTQGLASSERAGFAPARARSGLWSAAALIIIADAAMSLDNVVALAAIARGNFLLLAVGVALSIPVIAYGGLILTALLRNAPGVITLGAALLGWIAGDMAITDPLVADWADLNAPGLVALMPALGAAFVYLGARLRRDRPSDHPTSLLKNPGRPSEPEPRAASVAAAFYALFKRSEPAATRATPPTSAPR